MSLTRLFRSAQQANPTWGYREIADYLNCDINSIRGINSRLKLPVPVRPKAADGDSKSKHGDRRPYTERIVSAVTHIKPPKKRKAKPIPTAHQMGSGRKTYGGYLKLL